MKKSYWLKNQEKFWTLYLQSNSYWMNDWACENDSLSLVPLLNPLSLLIQMSEMC